MLNRSSDATGKVQRLKARSQFQAVLAGAVVARTVHFSMHRAGLPEQLVVAKPALWMGAMVPKRLAKRAVTRNAIKRQIYNIGTDFKAALPVAAHVVRLRSGFDSKLFVSATSDRLKSAVRQELQQLFTSAAVAGVCVNQSQSS